MSVIVGSDGAAQVNLGGGVKYIANIKSWRANLKRDMLRRTTQADEVEKRTAGLADWSGDFEFFLQFSDDVTTAQSSWQMLNFALTGTDDSLKANVALILQTHQVLPDCDIFSTTIPGVIKLIGTVVIGDVTINCEDPEHPLGLLVSWAGDGAMTLQRT